MWNESRAATCYGPLTVVAQWLPTGECRLIQLTDNRQGIGWKGKVWNQPASERWGKYWLKVFNLIAHGDVGQRPQTVLEVTR